MYFEVNIRPFSYICAKTNMVTPFLFHLFYNATVHDISKFDDFCIIQFLLLRCFTGSVQTLKFPALSTVSFFGNLKAFHCKIVVLSLGIILI